MLYIIIWRVSTEPVTIMSSVAISHYFNPSIVATLSLDTEHHVSECSNDANTGTMLVNIRLIVEIEEALMLV